MKRHPLATTALCLMLACQLVARAQDMDTEITKLTEDLATKISAKDCKKMTVVDFTDLENNPTELGKYVADQMTVDFAMNNRSFTVLDRAHLKKIMDEHKLTASGLVDPENAKQLGMLAGVDALIFGKAIPIGNNVSVTVQVISADTGTVFTAGKAKFQKDDSIQQLISKPAPAENPPETKQLKQPPSPVLYSQKAGDLLVIFNQMRGLHNEYRVDFTLQNTSANNSIAVAMYHDTCFVPPCRLLTKLIAGDGTELGCDDDAITGIGSSRWSPKPLTEIPPGGELRASMKFHAYGFDHVADTVTTFSFRPTFLVNYDYNASAYDNMTFDQNSLPPYCKLVSAFIDFPVTMH